MNVPLPAQQASRHQTPRAALIFLLCAYLAACGGAPPVHDSAVLEERVDAAAQLSAAPALGVDAQASEIQVRVYRAGLLARFGHNHLIAGPVAGRIFAGDTAADSGFSLRIPVADMRVDPPAVRAASGSNFAAEMSDEDRRDTRANMLGKNQLDARTYPEIVIESLALEGARENPDVTARVTLHGTARAVRFPAHVAETDDALVVTAQFSIRQSDFGIEPFSAFGGGLQVRDAIDVSVRLVARREE